MVKYIKISQNNCRPCGDLDRMIQQVAPDKLDKIKEITSFNEMTENGFMYSVKADEHPEFGAFYELMGVPVIIQLNEDNSKAAEFYKPNGQDLEHIFDTL